MGSRIVTGAGMIDHHSRLWRQQTEELGLVAEAEPPLPPLQPPPQEAVLPWHHRAVPIGDGLDYMFAEEFAASRPVMPRVLMPGEALPHF